MVMEQQGYIVRIEYDEGGDIGEALLARRGSARPPPFPCNRRWKDGLPTAAEPRDRRGASPLWNRRRSPA